MSAYKDLDKRDKTDFYTALAVIVAVLGFVLYYSFSDLFGGEEVAFLQSDIQDIRLDDTLVVEGNVYIPISINNKSNDNSLQVTHSTINQEYLDSNVVVNRTINKVSESDLVAPILNVDTVSDKIVEQVEEQVMDTVTSEEILEGLPRDTIITSAIVDTIKEIEVENPTTNNFEAVDKSCIIAVGIYRNKQNANKMLNRLEKAGYDAFLVERRNKYRVQVYRSCEENSLNTALEDIRTKYASDALVLVKK